MKTENNVTWRDDDGREIARTVVNGQRMDIVHYMNIDKSGAAQVRDVINEWLGATVETQAYADCWSRMISDPDIMNEFAKYVNYKTPDGPFVYFVDTAGNLGAHPQQEEPLAKPIPASAPEDPF